MSAHRIPLVGLTGAIGAGKDEVGNVLKRAGWRGMAFADALRIEAAEAWGCDIALFVHRTGKERPTPVLALEWCRNAAFVRWMCERSHLVHEPRSPRFAMQWWGTWRRAVQPLYWVHCVEQWVYHQRAHPPKAPAGLVITDVRFANEADMLGWLGGYLVRVHRPSLPALPADTGRHESELHTALPVSADLHNDGDLQHLAAEVQRVLNHLATLPAPGAPALP